MTSPSIPLVGVGNIAARIEDELHGAGEPARAEQEKRYLKTDLQHYGASVPAIRKIIKAAIAQRPGKERRAGGAFVCFTE